MMGEKGGKREGKRSLILRNSFERCYGGRTRTNWRTMRVRTRMMRRRNWRRAGTMRGIRTSRRTRTMKSRKTRM